VALTRLAHASSGCRPIPDALKRDGLFGVGLLGDESRDGPKVTHIEGDMRGAVADRGGTNEGVEQAQPMGEMQRTKIAESALTVGCTRPENVQRREQ